MVPFSMANMNISNVWYVCRNKYINNVDAGSHFSHSHKHDLSNKYNIYIIYLSNPGTPHSPHVSCFLYHLSLQSSDNCFAVACSVLLVITFVFCEHTTSLTLM